MEKYAEAKFNKIRQRTQYTCMAASLTMCLDTFGVKTDEDEVAGLMGVSSRTGGTWESVFAVAQHFGIKSALLVPSSIESIKKATDSGLPVMITWNPENRNWSHASVVYDVRGNSVFISDPNIPNPNKVVREVNIDDFYSMWYEKWPDFLVRRVAMIFSREVSKKGAYIDYL